MLQITLSEKLILDTIYPGDCKRCLFAKALNDLGYQEVWIDESWLRLKMGDNLKYFNMTKEAINLRELYDDGFKIKPQTIVLVENFNENP